MKWMPTSMEVRFELTGEILGWVVDNMVVGVDEQATSPSKRCFELATMDADGQCCGGPELCLHAKIIKSDGERKRYLSVEREHLKLLPKVTSFVKNPVSDLIERLTKT